MSGDFAGSAVVVWVIFIFILLVLFFAFVSQGEAQACCDRALTSERWQCLQTVEPVRTGSLQYGHSKNGLTKSSVEALPFLYPRTRPKTVPITKTTKYSISISRAVFHALVVVDRQADIVSRSRGLEWPVSTEGSHRAGEQASSGASIAAILNYQDAIEAVGWKQTLDIGGEHILAHALHLVQVGTNRDCVIEKLILPCCGSETNCDRNSAFQMDTNLSGHSVDPIWRVSREPVNGSLITDQRRPGIEHCDLMSSYGPLPARLLPEQLKSGFVRHTREHDDQQKQSKQDAKSHESSGVHAILCGHNHLVKRFVREEAA
jgi:hypothetical protein